MDSNDDGWTHVGRSKGRRAPKATPRQPLPDRHITLGSLQNTYAKYMRTWKASSCRKELRQILDKKQPDEGWQMREAICLASGSFSRDNMECQRRSMLQFVAFMDTVEHVQATSDSIIEVYAEELVYTAIDVEFLSGMGVTVHNDPDMVQHLSEDPSRWSHLGPHSMVFELYMEMAVPPMQALLQSDPKLLVASPLPERLATITVEPMPQLVKKFIAERGSYYVPRFEEDPGVFEGLNVFWKEPEEEDDES